MTVFRLILRNLVYYRRSHVWTVLGVMASTAILVGALVLGDSIRFSLRSIVFDRLGTTVYALVSGGRFMRTSLADRLSGELGTVVAPLLETRGTVTSGGGEQRLNAVRVVGVDDRFAAIYGDSGFPVNLSDSDAIVNTRVASTLGVRVGDELLLRADNPDFIPGDISWTPDSERSFARRYTVRWIASPDDFGGFNLNAEQVTPATVFVPLGHLGRETGLEDRCNVLLVAERPENPLAPDELEKALADSWTIADAGYEVRALPQSDAAELRSARLFLDAPVVRETQTMFHDARLVFSYFVNDIRSSRGSTPYSFVTASDDIDCGEGDIIVNEWLAEDLHVKPGDRITLTYYVLGPTRDLVEASAEFRIASVVPIDGVFADRSLMPDLPGITDSENCRDWDPGIPIDLDRIRYRDEAYWDDYRGTPKAFISLADARRLWENRYGDLTAIRFPGGGSDTARIEEAVSSAVGPESLGLVFRDVRRAGIEASANSVGFDQLFLGLSFFIIVAALLLTGMLFVFGVEQRLTETGLYLALGFPRAVVRRIVLLEGAALVLAGSIPGAFAGIAYNRIVLAALTSVWRDIVGTASLRIQLDPVTILTGVLAGIAVNFIAILVVSLHRFGKPANALQRGLPQIDTVSGAHSRSGLLLGVSCAAGAVLILLFARTGGAGDMVVPYFAAGILTLIGGVSFVHFLIAKYAAGASSTLPGVVSLGLRNTARNRFRSLSVAGLMACGIFVVFTVGANRKNTVRNAGLRESGTGGFTLYGECAIPVLYDLNGEKGREFYGLDSIDGDRVRFVSFRVGGGDDASCLNLNRVATPRIMGVEPSELSERQAFTFAKTTGEVDPRDPWAALDMELPDGVVPGIADQTVIVWGLGKAVGDTLVYIGEDGISFGVKLVGGLANSIFQGSVIVSERAFLGKFPSTGGYRMFLVDAPFAEADSIARAISWALEDNGVDLTRTDARLAAFNSVENTYLSIFLILGTFGLMLGSVGIGILIARNISERRGELALLKAVGFNSAAIRVMVVSEHGVLLAAGVIVGAVSAMLAVIPAVMAPGSAVPAGTLVLLLVLIAAAGGLWTYGATALVTRDDLIPALRNE